MQLSDALEWTRLRQGEGAASPAHGERKRAAHRVARPIAGVLVSFLAFWAAVPVVQFDDPLSTVILDRDGELLGAAIASDGQWRFGVADRVPEKFVSALTSYEDRRFFWHPGVDPLAMARAAFLNLKQGRVVRGGSTITMQVVRLSRRGRPRTYFEKAIEAVLSLRLTLSVPKREVLGLYAAYAPMGGNTVGLDAAAWRYFGKSAQHLSWAETATLAVLPNSPALVHPGRNRDLLRDKRNRLLDALRERGAIDAMTCALAKEEPLPPAPQPLPMLAPHLLARVSEPSARAQRAAKRSRGASVGVGPHELIEESRRDTRFRTREASPWVRTTLRKEVQIRAAEILARHDGALAANGVYNAAALILEVDTGRVVAYIGNQARTDSLDHGRDVDVIPAPRSTGSILKPLLYAAMLDAGEVLPGQLIPDIPTHLGSFHPENFDRAYSGAVPAERALARSLNVPAVRMLRVYGVERFCSLLRRLGMTTLRQPAQHYGLSLILGGAEGTLWDITGIYAGLARSAKAADGESTFQPPAFLDASGARPDTTRPLGVAASYLTLKAMLEVERPGDEVAWRSFGTGQKIAWKTGTSYGFRDAWAVGVTPKYAVGVWVGNADGEGRPGLTGYSAAAPILFELFGLLSGEAWPPEPVEDLKYIEVCARSGMRSGAYCERRRVEAVPGAALNAAPCPYCRLLHVDPSGTWQVHGECAPVASIRGTPWFVLPPVMETYYRRQHADYRPPPPYRPDCRAALGSGGSASLSCVYPKENAQVYVPIEMGGALGRVVFEAAHRDPTTRVFWHLDDEYFGETQDIHQMALAPAPGRHVLTLVDETGETTRRTFTVLRREVER